MVSDRAQDPKLGRMHDKYLWLGGEPRRNFISQAGEIVIVSHMILRDRPRAPVAGSESATAEPAWTCDSIFVSGPNELFGSAMVHAQSVFSSSQL